MLISIKHYAESDIYHCEECGAEWPGHLGIGHHNNACPERRIDTSGLRRCVGCGLLFENHNEDGSCPKGGEVRVTDPATGGQKGQKPQRFSLIPREFLWALAEHYGIGARKYEDRNWEKGYKWSLTQDALERHYNQFLLGERYDAETGSHHLIAAIWHLVALYIFDIRSLGTNDISPRLAPPTAQSSKPCTGPGPSALPS
jgi:hypothetical protein